MNKLFLKIFLLTTILIMILFLVITKSDTSLKAQTGDYIYTNISNIDKIVYTNKGDVFTMDKKDGIWRDDNGYYVDNKVVGNFLRDLKSTKYFNLITNKITFDNSIDLFSDGKKVLRLVADKDNYYAFSDAKLYTLNNKIYFPDNIKNLYAQPLLDIDDNLIDEVIGLDKPFSFKNLIFDEVIRKDRIKLNNKKHFQIVTKEGIDVRFSLSKTEDAYWLELNLAATILPSKDAAVFVKQNTPLYEDWLFKINNQLGEYLYN